MNFKKFIKLKEEIQQDEPMSEDEELLFNSLVQIVQGKEDCVSAKRRINPWKILTPAISFLGVVAITLTCIFALSRSNDYVYNYENIKNDQTLFSNMQADIKYFDIILNSADQINRYYDSETNDNLYYTCIAEIELSIIYLTVVINEKYDYKFEIANDAVSKELNDYTIIYSSESSRVDPQIKYKGWIKVETETVYFDYVQMPAMGDEAFFESIQQIIKLKN